MARKDSDIERLRAEVLARHAAASRKISRLRKQGIELAGTKYDLRREIAKVRRYNMAQLNAYLNQLLGFTSRTNQYVASAGGQPVPKKDWIRFQGIQARFNDYVAAHEERIANIEIPSHANQKGMTIRGREESLYGKRRISRAGGDIVNRPLSFNETHIANVNGAEALQELYKGLQKKMRPGYLNTRNKSTATSMSKMLSAIGDYEAIEKLHFLTNHQKDILFNYTNFAAAVSQTYGFKSMDTKNQYGSTIENNMGEINELLDWAATLPKKKGR